MSIRSLVGAVVVSSFLSLVSTTLIAAADEWSEKGWEFVAEKDGIKTYRKSYPNSPVKGVGGEAEIDAPIGKVLWVLMDHDHKVQWIDKFKMSRTLEEISPLSQVHIAAFDMPFPVSDREFIYTYDFRADTTLNGVVVDVKSIEHPKAPTPGKDDVRGEIVDGRYILIPRGDKTFVKAEYLADPKGSLPTWIVNMVQKSWPYKTLNGLRQQVKKDFVKTWPQYDSDLKPKLKLDK